MEHVPAIARDQRIPERRTPEALAIGSSDVVQLEPSDTSVCLEWVIERIQQNGVAE